MKHNSKSLQSFKNFIITFLLIISISASGGAYNLRAAADADIVGAFEERSILDDLNGATIAGKPFNASDYPADDKGAAQIISFVEFGYSSNAQKQSDYGLYFYVYNPRGYGTQIQSRQNKIQIAFGSSDSAEYCKYELKHLNSTDGGLILKYRVELTDAQKQTALKQLDKQSRVYKVSGLELISFNEYTAREYTVGATYTYTGYAQGYGESAQTESTLNCKCEGLETVSLNVNHTYYRTKTSNVGANHQVQLNTVYFSVPKALIEKYGRLQRIKAEWYEYVTKEIAVTNNKEVYDRLLPNMGYTLTSNYDSEIYYGFISAPIIAAQNNFSGRTMWNFNGPVVGSNLNGWQNINRLSTLYYMFYTGVDDIMSYDPYGKITEQGGILSNELYDYIKKYSSKQISSTLPIKDGRISAELFEAEIDAARVIDNERGKIQKGYSYYDFDINEDWQTIKTYNPNSAGFASNVNMYGLWNALWQKYGDVEYGKTLPPIQILSDTDIKGTSEEERKSISNNLYVNYNDVDDLQSYYSEATKNGDLVVLFRFATTDYWSEAMEISMGKCLPRPQIIQ